jgi:hypothetical protein
MQSEKLAREAWWRLPTGRPAYSNLHHNVTARQLHKTRSRPRNHTCAYGIHVSVASGVRATGAGEPLGSELRSAPLGCAEWGGGSHGGF